MITIQSESISNFRNNYNAVLQRLTKGPVLLLQYSDVAGVLLSKEEWNAIAERLEELEDIATAWKHKYEQAVGKLKTTPFELTEFIEDEEAVRVSH